jgi:RimJ/RimL family protein N-acetyltransferase
LTVRSSNQRAIALYAQLGFAHEGCQRNAIMAEDGYEDRDLMAYLVPEQPQQAA